MNTAQLEEMHSVGLYPLKPVTIVSGKGAKLYSEDGKEYLDFGASYGVGNVGHCAQPVVDAIRRQAGELLFVSATYPNPVRAKLQQKLASIMPEGLDRVFLCNSGTEAVEAAFKFARFVTKRERIVAMKRAFHGRTFGALSATFKKEYREGFGTLLPVDFISFNEPSEVAKAVTSDTAAVIVEPVQGEGGVHPATPEFLKAIESACRDKGALFILDEIQTGFGRTGRMFAMEHTGARPDIVCLAKSLGGGFPIGAMVTTKERCILPKAAHGSTFGGNPLACAAALAAIDMIQEIKLWERAEKLGNIVLSELNAAKLSAVREIRGKGLMIGIELKQKSAPYLSKLVERGLLAMPAGVNVIRLLPPLVISEEELRQGISILKEVLSSE
jgi:acetylornithine/LysW-gamma-L-lysine aminotransferase